MEVDIIPEVPEVPEKRSLLQIAGVTRKKYLSPKQKKLYDMAFKLRKTVKRLKIEKAINKRQISKAMEFAKTELFIKSVLNKTSFNFLMSQLRLQKRKEKVGDTLLMIKYLHSVSLNKVQKAIAFWKKYLPYPVGKL